MDSEVLVAFVCKLVGDRVANATSELVSKRGPRGFQGIPGQDGTPFFWGDHEQEIKSLIREASLKFSDLSHEEIEQLRGPRGISGKDGLPGKDGNSFEYLEHKEEIESFIRKEISNLSSELKLKFSDLSSEDIETIRGPRGPRGHSGKDFVFEEHLPFFDSLKFKFSDLSFKEKEELKFKFSDLSFEEVEKLRGPRGQRGKPGKDFVFEEHRPFFETLKLKFSDLSLKDKDDLKLKFSDLSEEDLEALKLKFSDLSEEDLIRLKGPRGQRGKQGAIGLDGKDGLSIRGPIGPPGVMGLRGIPGISGRNGIDGKDAPEIYDISVEKYGEDKYFFKFYFTDGSVIETNPLEVPSKQGGQSFVAMGVAVSSAPTAPKLVATFDTDIGTMPGDFVTVNGVNSVTKIVDNLEATIPNGVFGVGFNKPTATTIEVIFSGIKDGYSGLTVGSPLFISATGTPTHTPPVSGMVQQIGFAVKSTDIFIQMLQPMRRA